MKRSLSKFLVIVQEADTTVAELFMGPMSVIWGLVVLNPTATTFTGSGSRAMTDLADEWVWGMALFVSGLLMCMALYKDDEDLRVTACASQAALWMFVAAMIFSGNAASTGWVVYGMVGLLAAFCAVRIPRTS